MLGAQQAREGLDESRRHSRSQPPVPTLQVGQARCGLIADEPEAVDLGRREARLAPLAGEDGDHLAVETDGKGKEDGGR